MMTQALDTITLYHFGRVGGLPDISPFCVKLETWLRLAGIPYDLKVGNPRQAPKGKLPYIRHGERLIGDSGYIIDHLRRHFGPTLDQGLDAAARADARAWQSLLEEHLYFVLVYARWQSPAGWSAYKPYLAEALVNAGAPALVAQMLLPVLRRGTLQSLQAQGVGRHSPDELDRMSAQLIEALGARLADAAYFGGESPSSLDASAYGMLSGVAGLPVPSALADAMRAQSNLVAYCERLRARVWSDLARPQGQLTA